MADRWNHERRDEEEEGEEDGGDEFTEGHYKAQKDALIFAIQVSESMLRPPPKSEDKKSTQDSASLTALKCAYQVMQQRIISNPKDMIGIILFGTNKTKVPEVGLQDSRCYLLTDLEVPAADDVKALRGLVEEGEDTDEILTPSEQPADMVILLRLVLHLFQTRAPNFGSRRLFIVTDNDDPCAGMKKNPSWDPAVGAKDIHDHGCTIELFPITHGESEFATSKFYDDIIYRDPVLDETNPGQVAPAKSGEGLDLLQSLVSNINSRQTPKRAYFSNMPFEIGPGLTISVKGYNIIQQQSPARSCYIWLEGEKPQVAIGETARLAEDSARTVENNEVKRAYKFGNEYVYFTDEEQKSIKQFGGSCIRIIGFKDRSLLKFWASVHKSIYFFPSEDGYVGSTRVFTALWQKLLRSKKVGVAWHIARKNANPRLVAIIPSRATSDDGSGTQYLPAGLWIYPIPFIDDVREGPETGKVIRTTNALTDRMNKVVQQLQLPGGAYNPFKYANPALQWHYKILQALALEDVVPDHPEDATVPKHRAIHKRCGGYIQEWSRVADDVLEQIRDGQKIKRELEGDNGEDEPRPAKRARSTTVKDNSTGGDGLNNTELRKRYDAGTLTKLTVAELRAAMSSRGLDTKGLKKDLVEKLEQWVEDNV
ncbi:putative ATP-dependent DNA helicase II subunit 1 [Rosellinia necatrix]|uniref:ATP-dependent DNA helicase II subunit 1 n=1 Tax=Rosellinia necatrix TaxID=77044 RepID=A0A1W2TDC0_ROSNE|nr:putative ATP-dependent DNA helicase II subunit 1 [Rosellinia necatrix]